MIPEVDFPDDTKTAGWEIYAPGFEMDSLRLSKRSRGQICGVPGFSAGPLEPS